MCMNFGKILCVCFQLFQELNSDVNTCVVVVHDQKLCHNFIHLGMLFVTHDKKDILT